MPCTLPEALRLKGLGMPQDSSRLVYVKRMEEKERWFLEERQDRLADREAHVIGSFVSGGFALDWVAAPEPEEAKEFERGLAKKKA